MDGVTFSGGAVSAAQGSGTFALFNFTGHVPAGSLTLDNSTGPYVGGTLITLTLSPVAVAPRTRNVTVNVPYNLTKRVYLDDPGVGLLTKKNALHLADGGSSGSGSSARKGSTFYGIPILVDDDTDRWLQVTYEGVMYDVIYPVPRAAANIEAAVNAAAADTTEASFYGLGLLERDEMSDSTSAAAANSAATAAQVTSYDSEGCSLPTAAASAACRTSMEPYALVTVGGGWVETRSAEQTRTKRQTAPRSACRSNGTSN